MKFFAFMLCCVFASESVTSLINAAKLNNATVVGIIPLKDSSQIIEILVVIDSDTLVATYERGSMNPDQPKSISHNYAFMVAPAKYVKSGQGTADLHLKADVGDTFRYFSTSLSSNMNSQVFVYNLKFTPVLSLSAPQIKSLKNIPCVEVIDGNITNLVQSKCNNYYLNTDAQEMGVISYTVHFALYERRSKTKQMRLNGYYRWDPTITVE